MEKIKLEVPDVSGGLPLYHVLKNRHSVRNYSREPIDFKTLSQLLWCSQGINLVRNGYHFRTAPSAGALYPIETYVLVNKMSGLNPGIYHYHVIEHVLTVKRDGNFGEQLAAAALNQRVIRESSIVILLSAVVSRTAWKYEQRAYRYIYLEAGHITQNLALAAVSCGLGTCQIGAFYDDQVNALLQLDGEDEKIIYISTVGKP